MLKTVGIDLGTTNSEIYKMTDGGPQPVMGTGNLRLTPSRLAVDPKSTSTLKYIHGKKSANTALKNVENVLYEPKRLIGRRFNDDYVRCDRLYWSFDVVEGEDGMPYYHVTTANGKVQISPVEVDAEILRELKSYVKEGVENCIITVPSYFSKEQISATTKAGELAGFTVMRCIPEPVAACIAYGQKHDLINGLLLVYDLGGGTFDCCIVHINDGHYTVLSNDGHIHLGGANFDNAIARLVINEIETETGYSILHEKKDMGKLKDTVEKAKIGLTSAGSHKIDFDYNIKTNGVQERKKYQRELTVAEFNQMITNDIEMTIQCIERSLEQLGKDKKEINDVILVGGSTRIPYVQKRLNKFFGHEINPNLVNIDEAVAEGASIYAANLYNGIEMLVGGEKQESLFRCPDYSSYGDIIRKIPCNIYLNVGNGPKLLFEKGSQWNTTKENEDAIIRVVKEVNPHLHYCTEVQFRVYSEDPRSNELSIIGQLSYIIADPDVREKISMHLIVEYTNRGHICLSVRMKGSLMKDQIDITCRGDALDEYDEKERTIQRTNFEKDVKKMMMRYMMCGNGKTSIDSRLILTEMMIWLNTNTTDFDEDEFRNLQSTLYHIKN